MIGGNEYEEKILALLLAAACVVTCKAENGTDGVGGEITAGTKPEGAEQAQPEETDQTETGSGEYEYPPDHHGMELWESPLGYSMPYDPTVFTVDDTGEADVFTYNTAEKLDAPVYISILPYPDMDIQTLADGIALQSGMDEVMVDETFLGADGIESKLVYIEKDVDGIKQIQIFYAIPEGEGSLLMEIGTYEGVPEMIDSKIEEMLGNFKLTAE